MGRDQDRIQGAPPGTIPGVGQGRLQVDAIVDAARSLAGGQGQLGLANGQGLGPSAAIEGRRVQVGCRVRVAGREPVRDPVRAASPHREGR